MVTFTNSARLLLVPRNARRLTGTVHFTLRSVWMALENPNRSLVYRYRTSGIARAFLVVRSDFTPPCPEPDDRSPGRAHAGSRGRAICLMVKPSALRELRTL